MLPDALCGMIADFCGDTTIGSHRRHSFLQAEIKIFACAGIMKPSYIRTVEGFKDMLQLVYRQQIGTQRIP